MTTILVATRNAHKVEEIGQILGPEFRCLTLRNFPDAPGVIEDAATFEGNAEKKALSLGRWLAGSARETTDGRFFILADDSGLEVDALGGEPGVRSARFAASESSAATNSPDFANNAKLLRLLAGQPLEKRTARFRCVLALVGLSMDAEKTLFFEGSCEGNILDNPSGAGGFGYDPLFVPRGYGQSFAELGADIKNKISHRARALEKLKAWLAS